MDPITTTLTGIGLTLAVIGAVTLVAWRYGRSRARIPAIMLAAAVVVLAAPPLLDLAGKVIDPTPHDVAGIEHPEDAVVHPDELERR